MIKKPKNYSNLLNLEQNLASRIIQYLDALATNHPKSSQRISTNIHGKLCSHDLTTPTTIYIVTVETIRVLSIHRNVLQGSLIDNIIRDRL